MVGCCSFAVALSVAVVVVPGRVVRVPVGGGTAVPVADG